MTKTESASRARAVYMAQRDARLARYRSLRCYPRPMAARILGVTVRTVFRYEAELRRAA